MWRIHRRSDGDCVVLSISGRLASEELVELEKAVSGEEAERGKVELDLRDVKLVDQQAVTFLARCEAKGTRLRNCAAYIREWIGRETAAPRPQD